MRRKITKYKYSTPLLYKVLGKGKKAHKEEEEEEEDKVGEEKETGGAGRGQG